MFVTSDWDSKKIMASKNMAPLIFMCMILFMSFVSRGDAGQNCYCECMKYCQKEKISRFEECGIKCEAACSAAGFPGKPKDEMKTCVL